MCLQIQVIFNIAYANYINLKYRIHCNSLSLALLDVNMDEKHIKFSLKTNQ